MVRKMICFDMDGTLCDLYGVPNWLEKLQAEDPSPYQEAEPLWDMDELNKILLDLINQGWEIRIISWLAKNSTEAYKKAVRIAKRGWLLKYHMPIDFCHLVEYGTTKADCVRRITKSAILVDDDSNVRVGWHLGKTINPKENNLLEELEKLLEEEEY